MESKQIRQIALSSAYPFNGEYSSEDEVTGVPTINTKTAFGLNKIEFIATHIMASLMATERLDRHECADIAVQSALVLIEKIYE